MAGAFSSKEGDTPPQLDLVFGSGIGLAVSELVYDAVTDAVTLTWNEIGAGAYTVKYSHDLLSWNETLADQVTPESDEKPEVPESITATFDLSENESDDRIFFRIEED